MQKTDLKSEIRVCDMRYKINGHFVNRNRILDYEFELNKIRIFTHKSFTIFMDEYTKNIAIAGVMYGQTWRKTNEKKRFFR